MKTVSFGSMNYAASVRKEPVNILYLTRFACPT